MEKISGRRVAHLLLPIALVLAGSVGCQKKSQTAEPSSSPTAGACRKLSAIQADDNGHAPPITGPVTPALVSQQGDSITHYLHYPKDPAVAETDGAVQFYCEVTESGSVETTHALIANNDAFKEAVQKALDWGRFTPATVDGKPVRVYLGGTVLFLHQNGEELIVVSLATHDRDRVGKLANYIQPQLIGGLRHTLERADQLAHPGHSRRRQGGSRGECGRQGRGHEHVIQSRKIQRVAAWVCCSMAHSRKLSSPPPTRTGRPPPAELTWSQISASFSAARYPSVVLLLVLDGMHLIRGFHG